MHYARILKIIHGLNVFELYMVLSMGYRRMTMGTHGITMETTYGLIIHRLLVDFPWIPYGFFKAGNYPWTRLEHVASFFLLEHFSENYIRQTIWVRTSFLGQSG